MYLYLLIQLAYLTHCILSDSTQIPAVLQLLLDEWGLQVTQHQHQGSVIASPRHPFGHRWSITDLFVMSIKVGRDWVRCHHRCLQVAMGDIWDCQGEFLFGYHIKNWGWIDYWWIIEIGRRSHRVLIITAMQNKYSAWAMVLVPFLLWRKGNLLSVDEPSAADERGNRYFVSWYGL